MKCRDFLTIDKVNYLNENIRNWSICYITLRIKKLISNVLIQLRKEFLSKDLNQLCILIYIISKNSIYKNNKYFDNCTNDDRSLKNNYLYNSILNLTNDPIIYKTVIINSNEDCQYHYIYEEINLVILRQYIVEDIGFENEIITMSIKEFVNTLSNINKFIATKKYEYIKDISQNIKTYVLLFGLYSLNNFLTELENLCKKNAISEIFEISIKIKFCLRKNIKELERILGFSII